MDINQKKWFQKTTKHQLGKEGKLMVLSTVIVSAAITLIEGLPLIKNKMWKELISLIVLLLIAVFFAIEKALNLPTLVDIMNHFLYPLGKTIFKS